MAFETVREFPLANIVRVDIITEEETPKSYRLTDVATEANSTAFISEGAENELRVKNTIKAQNKFEDIVKGYDTTLTSATMVGEILALIDGGTLRYDAEETTKIVGYDAPPIGSVVSRTPFTAKIYTAEKDVDGSDVSYVCFNYLHCKGTPVNYVFTDGEFFAPQLLFESRPKMGESPVTLDFYDELPA